MYDVIAKIQKLRIDKNATILAHNYQIPEVQDIADFVGDSLQLAQQAVQTSAEVIIFCGVHFMAETAAILNPDKIVVLPDIHAGCPMADMIDASQLNEEKNKYPLATVITYVNSTAEVKAESDYCCTSSNAVAVAKAVEGSEVLFVPDQFLGMWVSKQVPEKKFHFWKGYCPTHARIVPQDILEAKRAHPDAIVIVHPECRVDVTALADAVLSTGGMLKFARESEAGEIIVGTEVGILHRMRKENPQKQFYPASTLAVCPNMKRITLTKVERSLETLTPLVEVTPEIADHARQAIERMLAIV